MATAPLNRSLVGERVGSYVVERQIGAGGMGAVFLARHVELAQKTAVIKVLLAEMVMRRDLVERFKGEARAATALDHPAIVRVEDFGSLSTGEPFIVMEHLEGQDLAKHLAGRGRLELDEALSIMIQVCPGLDAAHDRGIIHRDLKLENLFLLQDGRAKILDFGIAKLLGDLAGHHQTSAWAVAGTVGYMSPEQCRSTANVDRRSDVFALGVILYALLTGRPPWWSQTTAADHLHRIDHEPPPHPLELRPELPIAWASAIMAALAREPDRRPPTAGALLQLLLRGLPGSDRVRRRVAEIVAGLPPSEDLAAGSAPPPVLGPTDLTARVVAPTGGAPVEAAPVIPNAFPIVLPAAAPPLPGPETAPLPIAAPSLVPQAPAAQPHDAEPQTVGADGVPTPIEEIEGVDVDRGSAAAHPDGGRRRRMLAAGAIAGAAAALVVSVIAVSSGDDKTTTPDAGAPFTALALLDAAPPDAATPDAATPDAATLDAAPSDAAPPDAATPEAAPSDGTTKTPNETGGTPTAGGADAAARRVYADLDVYCLDSSCDVFVDGASKGSTPATIRVPVGTHTVRLQHPERSDLRATRRITVKAGRKNEISHAWNQ